MTTQKHIAIIGGGPAGLIAAERLSAAGCAVTLYDAMPSVGRKFLLAGTHGGLNLTHSEPLETFVTRYSSAPSYSSPLAGEVRRGGERLGDQSRVLQRPEASAQIVTPPPLNPLPQGEGKQSGLTETELSHCAPLEKAVRAFPPQALIAWCHALGQETFTGTSGRVFPKQKQAKGLLRAWLKRLEAQGVVLAARHRWMGWDADENLVFETPEGEVRAKPEATLLALGGASWPRTGSNGAWVGILRDAGVALAPLEPANCGFIAPWSGYFGSRFAGQPIKPVRLFFEERTLQGELMVTAKGLEGSAVYALSAALRARISADGHAVLSVDLRPSLTHEALAKNLHAPRKAQTFTTYLRKAGGLSPVAIGLLREVTPPECLPVNDIEKLARLIKALPVSLTKPAPIARAISTAGGVRFEALDDHLMLREKPGVFIAGEMLDWDAPTGGYLLQGCFATGVMAAAGMLQFLE